MLIQSERWGEVDVADERVFLLPDGLVGFPGPLRIALLDDADADARAGAEAMWLQVVDEPGLAFSAIVPWLRFPHYEPELPVEDQAALVLDSEDDALVVCLLAGDDEARPSTANLLAPVVMNTRTGIGRQVVLWESSWPLRAPVAA